MNLPQMLRILTTNQMGSAFAHYRLRNQCRRADQRDSQQNSLDVTCTYFLAGTLQRVLWRPSTLHTPHRSLRSSVRLLPLVCGLHDIAIVYYRNLWIRTSA